MVYVHICDSHQILDHKPKKYGMGTHIKIPVKLYAYGYGAKPYSNGGVVVETT